MLLMGSIDPIWQDAGHFPTNVIDRSHLSILLSTEATANPTDLGAAIRARRRQLGITQDDLASSIAVSRRVIGQIETGKETAQVGIVLRAARAVGLDVGVEARE
jgi:DNA-binding XRE family transcriptional regulator